MKILLDIAQAYVNGNSTEFRYKIENMTSNNELERQIILGLQKAVATVAFNAAGNVLAQAVYIYIAPLFEQLFENAGRGLRQASSAVLPKTKASSAVLPKTKGEYDYLDGIDELFGRVLAQFDPQSFSLSGVTGIGDVTFSTYYDTDFPGKLIFNLPNDEIGFAFPGGLFQYDATNQFYYIDGGTNPSFAVVNGHPQLTVTANGQESIIRYVYDVNNNQFNPEVLQTQTVAPSQQPSSGSLAPSIQAPNTQAPSSLAPSSLPSNAPITVQPSFRPTVTPTPAPINLSALQCSIAENGNDGITLHAKVSDAISVCSTTFNNATLAAFKDVLSGKTPSISWGGMDITKGEKGISINYQGCSYDITNGINGHFNVTQTVNEGARAGQKCDYDFGKPKDSGGGFYPWDIVIGVVAGTIIGGGIAYYMYKRNQQGKVQGGQERGVAPGGDVELTTMRSNRGSSGEPFIPNNAAEDEVVAFKQGSKQPVHLTSLSETQEFFAGGASPVATEELAHVPANLKLKSAAKVSGSDELEQTM